MDKLAVTIHEACQLTGLSRAEVYRQLSRGTLSAKKLGKRRTLIEIDELRRFIASLPAARMGANPIRSFS